VEAVPCTRLAGLGSNAYSVSVTDYQARDDGWEMIGDVAARIIRLRWTLWRPGKKETSVLFLLENCMDKVAGPAE
jgi:hypothetical protein